MLGKTKGSIRFSVPGEGNTEDIVETQNLNTLKNRLRCHLANLSSEHLVLQTCVILYILYLVF